MDKRILLLLVILSFFQHMQAAEKDDPCHKTTEGNDFWFGFMENRFRDDRHDHYVEVTLTSAVISNYEIRIGKADTVYRAGTINPNNPERFEIDWRLVEATDSENTEAKAIHLTSDNPINVYALNHTSNSSDVAVIFPTNTLGKEYYTICYEPHINLTKDGYNGRNSEFLIVATEDSTIVSIMPSMITDQGKPAGLPYDIKLNRGEFYQVQSMNLQNLVGQGDLTGSYIKSDKPVAVFSGAEATTVPDGPTVSAWDHLFEQIPPIQAWGTKFMAVPLKSRDHDIYRILAAYDNTTVKMGNGTVSKLSKSQFLEFVLSHNDPRLIESSKPVLLVQYSCSRSEDDAYTQGNGDPFMVIVSPVVQTKQNVNFVAYDSPAITDRYFVNVIAKDDAKSFISLDGNLVSFNSLPNSGYSYAQVTINQGSHILQSSAPDKGFIAYVYGFGGFESYGYGVGFNLDIQLDLGYKYLMNDSLEICFGTEVKLEAGAYFDSYTWNTGVTEPVIMADKQRKYVVTATTNKGCILSDSVTIKVNKPKIDLGKDTVTCGHGELVLDPGDKFVSYQWQDNSTKQTYAIYNTGDYSVTGINEFECVTSDQIHVDVLSPKTGFSPNYEVVNIEFPEITFLNETEGAVKYYWDFGDGTTSQETNPIHRFPAIGNYHVVLEAISEYDCADSMGKDVRIVPFTFNVPNAFRPDSEIAENRTFRPLISGSDPTKYTLEIVNRNGSFIFESRDLEIGWDGKLKNGASAEPGIYIWLIRYSGIQGFEKLRKGTFMLIR